MAVTGDIFKSLTFDGESSRDYGVYITGQAVYNAPERDVEMVTIPGRSGAFALDKGRFENIEVTYPAGVFANTETEFAKAISDFRNMLCSRKGYCRLTDEYNPDEYRLAVYKSGLEVDPVQLKAGQFDITFECKPQRYLTSGEEKKVLGTWGDTETKTGEIVELENDGTLAVKSAEVVLEPQQDLHGYDKPWNGGAGKNKLGISGADVTSNGITFSVQADGTIKATGTLSGSSASAYFTASIPTGSYVFNDEIGGSSSTYWSQIVDGTNWSGVSTGGGDTNFSITTTSVRVYVATKQTPPAGGLIFKPMMRLSGTSATWEPYTNICPITGASDVDVNVADDYDDPQTLNTYTTSLGTTVYGGSVDVVAGTGTVTWGVLKCATDTFSVSKASNYLYYIPRPNIGTYFDLLSTAFATGTSPNVSLLTPGACVGNPEYHVIYLNTTDVVSTDTAAAVKQWLIDNSVDFVYKIATPTTLTLTPTTVNLIDGTNYVFSPQGEITLEYGTGPNFIVNPTLFGCGPLIEAKGYGDISFNGHTIKLANGAIGTVNLWQETRGGTFNGSITKTFVTGQFEPTDTFSFTVTHMFTLSEVNPSITNTNANATNSRDIGVGWEITYRIDLPCTFTVGTTGQITNTSTYDFGAGKKVISDMDVSYDSTTGTVVYTVATTTQGQPSFEGTKHGFSISECNAVSTLNRLGDPTYIDCDLGEAYKINGGDVVSLNSFVDLGSKLPELAPGINEFTVSNTFTEVAVVPRWWIV